MRPSMLRTITLCSGLVLESTIAAVVRGPVVSGHSTAKVVPLALGVSAAEPSAFAAFIALKRFRGISVLSMWLMVAYTYCLCVGGSEGGCRAGS